MSSTLHIPCIVPQVTFCNVNQKRVTVCLERARLRVIEKERADAAAAGDNTRIFDLSVAVRKSRGKLSGLLE
jgi:hypothetical protein